MLHLTNPHSLYLKKKAINHQTIGSRVWNVIARNTQTQRNCFIKKYLSPFLVNEAAEKRNIFFVFSLGRRTRMAFANNKKSNKSYRTWEFKVAPATLGACHVQLTFLSGMPVVSSVDEILCPRRWLSRGTRTNRKIFHCVSISNGGWRVERRAFGGVVGGRSSNRSLPAELIAYSENNVPYPRSSEGRMLAEATFFCVWWVQKEERLGVLAILGV